MRMAIPRWRFYEFHEPMGRALAEGKRIDHDPLPSSTWEFEDFEIWLPETLSGESTAEKQKWVLV